jgi:hypothetical protein
MVLIPQQECPTLAAVKAASERAQVREQRDYIGASAAGQPCVRAMWYDYHGYKREPFKANTLWAFEDGHHSEAIMAARLRAVEGIELWTHKSDSKQYGWSAMGDKFKGHVDGVILGLIQAPKAPHVWEHKCSAAKKFDEFTSLLAKWGEKATLEQWNMQYFVQAQLNMHFMQIDRHYLTVALAGSRDVAACRTEYQPEVAQHCIDRVGSVLQAEKEPARMSDKPDYYVCRWCKFAKECHG